jgi:hypothetical protein
MGLTIRDLLWLTVVVALGVAWWVDRRELAERVTKLETTVYSLIVPGRILIQEEDESKPGIELPNPSAQAPNLPGD